MAITYLGEQHFGSADDANTTTDPLVLDKDVAPFTTISSGDVVVVFVNWRNNTDSSSVSVTGGQTWTEHFEQLTNAFIALYSCVFNGTWTADPQFDFAGTAVGGIGWAMAYSGVDNTTPWDVSPTAALQATSTTYVIADYNTNTNGALAFVGGASLDNNTWSVDNSFAAVSGAGNIYWRNSAGNDSSMVLASKSIATAGAVGATTMTQATLGGDAGSKWFGALKPASGGGGAATTMTVITGGL